MVAPAAMSDEAVKFWSDALAKVSKTEDWKTNYIDKNKLIPNYMSSAEAYEYITNYEKDFMEANGIK